MGQAGGHHGRQLAAIKTVQVGNLEGKSTFAVDGQLILVESLLKPEYLHYESLRTSDDL
jgi:hypothetical protein